MDCFFCLVAVEGRTEYSWNSPYMIEIFRGAPLETIWI